MPLSKIDSDSLSAPLTVPAGSAAAPAITTTGNTNTGIFFPAADTIAFAEGGAEAMRIDSSGNVGIGTSSPSVNLEIGSNTSTVRVLAVRYSSIPAYLSSSFDGTSGLSTFSANNYNTSNGSSSFSSFSNVNYGSSAVQLAASTGGADIRFLTASAANTNPSERARIDSSGNLLVACTSSPSSTVRGAMLGPNGPSGVQLVLSNTITSTFAGLVSFINGNGTVGTINTSGSSTSYNTSSDYRLKEAIAPMTGALAKVALLKPCTYKWKVDGSDGQGFIAHELQEVVEGCVTGEKDAVDADGKPQYQGIDTSFLVATLTAAIQELKAIVDAQGAEIAALKGTP